jgi:hypothetical protein
VKELTDGFTDRRGEPTPYCCNNCGYESTEQQEFVDHLEAERHGAFARGLKHDDVIEDDIVPGFVTPGVSIEEHYDIRPFDTRCLRCKYENPANSHFSGKFSQADISKDREMIFINITCERCHKDTVLQFELIESKVIF